jgi:hypothetical protein
MQKVARSKILISDSLKGNPSEEGSTNVYRCVPAIVDGNDAVQPTLRFSHALTLSCGLFFLKVGLHAEHMGVTRRNL